MTDLNQQWQQSNARQLGEALAALRQRLESFIQRQPPAATAGKPVTPSSATVKPETAPTSAVPASPAPKTISRSLLHRLLGSGSESAKPSEPSPTSSPSSSERDATAKEPPVTEAKAQPADPPSALALLAQRMGLSLFEQNVLLLCSAMELDTRIPSLCARAQDDPQKPFPTFALALALFDEPSWDVLSPERPLRFWRLVEVNQPAGQPLTASALRVDERVINYIKGLNYLDDRVSPFLLPMELETGTAELAPSQAEVVEMMVRHWQRAAESGPLPVVQLLGPDPVSKQLVAQYAATKLGRYIYRLPVELLPGTPSELESFARLWQRECLLLPLALYLDAEEWESATAERCGPIGRFFARSDGVFFVAVREVVPRPGRAHIAFDIAKPTAAEQQAAWTEALGDSAPDSPALLAAQFNLNVPNIRQLARLARAEDNGAAASLPNRIWDTCRASERPRLDALAQRLEPKMTWDDLVLPAAEMDLLRQIAVQVGQRNKVYGDWGFSRKMNRGFGISALFAGDSGTGKTMAAEVIANGLRLNLYRIDLSAVVNKYIGETEKNLRRLFDAAEASGAILFFDEADALFGKRSEVKDSHDRYANIEINYLLQRIESYRGLAILATNMKSALDAAFLRRLRFIVNFPFPGLADRLRLWRKVFLQDDVARNLPGPPVDKLDYDRLARMNLTGGHIHNVALNASFMAAHEGTKVTMPLVLASAKAELLKLDRPINEADFRWAETEANSPKATPKNKEPALA